VSTSTLTSYFLPHGILALQLICRRSPHGARAPPNEAPGGNRRPFSVCVTV
jgi:hypothetical protein